MRKSRRKYTVFYRRKREGKTDYKLRLGLLVGDKPRLVIRGSLRGVVVQLVKYEPKGDKVIAQANSNDIVRLGWKFSCGNIPSAYLIGLVLARKAMNLGVSEAVLDIGLARSVKSTRIYSALKGVIDSGLKVPCAEDVFPKDDRIEGKHISQYAQLIKDKKVKGSEYQFMSYAKDNIDLTQFTGVFGQIKEKILKM